jgi:peptidyl-Lys metalloendopeptidase
MSNNVRTICVAAALVAAAGTAFAARHNDTTSDTLDNPMSLRMVADGNRAFLGSVEFKMTNNSLESIKIPSWQLPNGAVNADVFEIYRNGRRIEYTGPMIKRAAPTEADYVTLRPGETKVVNVDLTQAYDLSQGGQYDVRFKSYLQNAHTDRGRTIAKASGQLATLESAPLRLWVDAGNPLLKLKPSAAPSAKATAVVNGVSFVGCTSSRQTTAGQAVVAARNYTENAKGYLNAGTVGSRYTTWFGSYTSSRYGTARSHFANIDAAMDQSGGQIKINCGCTQSYYAYVYPNRPYEIFVCNAFWSAPLTGTDSKAGTLVHEMSHFDIVANTDDVVYGQSGAKNLAISNPTDALRNADSHEYFGENNPAKN